MAAAVLEKLTPLPTLLPPGPTEDVFTEAQWKTFLSIADTVIPSIQRESNTTDHLANLVLSTEKYDSAVAHVKATVVGTSDDEALNAYFLETPSQIAEFKNCLERMLGFYVPEKGRKALGFILSALNTRVGCRLLTGYTTSFHEQPVHIRQAIIESWRTSYLPTFNVLFKQFTSISKLVWLRTSPLFPEVSGFPRVPDHYKPGKHYEYEFMQIPAGSEPEIIETDVVIVGSGCGGAVAAKNLAAAGLKILVVDKGYYFPPTQLPMTELSAAIHLYENGGASVSETGTCSVIAGSNWGGGGTVNWSASLQTQSFVRKEWAARGLPFFETAEFQKSLDRVCDRMGVSTEFIEHNHGNRMLLEGARKLGYTAKAVPQNSGGAIHNCGHCGLGCGAAQKHGTVITWLPDAAKSGAKFLEGFEVKEVTFDETAGSRRATGVRGRWIGRNSQGATDGPLSDRIVREIIIKAKRVVISAGTLWSPVILMNSGLTNWQIGRNLHLHPVNVVAAVFDHDVRAWEGPILSSVCTSFEDLDGKGHGAKIEVTAMMPTWVLTLMNWENGLDYKSLALKFRHMNAFISICRDRDTGRVWVDPVTGKPRIDYAVSAFDRAHIMEGNVAIAKMAYVSGAREIHAAICGVKPFIRPSSPSNDEEEEDFGVTDPLFVEWLDELRRVGNNHIGAAIGSAHQMGTCRMGKSESEGVVDQKGKVWGTEGLYVSDASVFPSASGVNPMVTTMAISDWISRNLAKDLKSEA